MRSIENNDNLACSKQVDVGNVDDDHYITSFFRLNFSLLIEIPDWHSLQRFRAMFIAIYQPLHQW